MKPSSAMALVCSMLGAEAPADSLIFSCAEMGSLDLLHALMSKVDAMQAKANSRILEDLMFIMKISRCLLSHYSKPVSVEFLFHIDDRIHLPTDNKCIDPQHFGRIFILRIIHL